MPMELVFKSLEPTHEMYLNMPTIKRKQFIIRLEPTHEMYLNLLEVNLKANP